MAYQDGYSGQLGNVKLIDVLSELASSKRSARVTIANVRFPTTLWFKHGDLVDVECGDLTGLAAAYRALALSHGTITVADERVSHKRVICEGLSQMLSREYCMRSDWTHVSASTPALTARMCIAPGVPQVHGLEGAEERFLAAIEQRMIVADAIEAAKADAGALLSRLGEWVEAGVVEELQAVSRSTRLEPAPMQVVSAPIQGGPRSSPMGRTLVGMPAVARPVGIAPTISKGDVVPKTDRGVQLGTSQLGLAGNATSMEVPPVSVVPTTHRGVAPQGGGVGADGAPTTERVPTAMLSSPSHGPPPGASAPIPGVPITPVPRVAPASPVPSGSPAPGVAPSSPVPGFASVAAFASGTSSIGSPRVPTFDAPPPSIVPFPPASSQRPHVSIAPQRTLDIAGGNNDDVGAASSRINRAIDSGAAGAMLGRYKIVERIGRGGMGTVYRAQLLGGSGFVRSVAIKVLRSQYAGSDGAFDMLLKEANIASRLQHRNVVSVIDVGTSDDQPYLVMDYVHGHSLATLLEKTPREATPERIVTILLDALSGLDAIHKLSNESGQRLGVVHNDVSPENILVGTDGTARIGDLGVASLGRDHEAAQRGKPGYLSPERIRGAQFDKRSDVFSIGVVMWNALTGLELHGGASAGDVMRNVLTKQVPPPSTVGRLPPPELDAVCLKALARDPFLRYQSAEEMLIDLRRVAVSREILAPPSSVSAWISMLGTTPDSDPPTSRSGAISAVGSTEPEATAPPSTTLPPPARSVAASQMPHAGPTDTQRLPQIGGPSRRVVIAQGVAALLAIGVLAYVTLHLDGADTTVKKPSAGAAPDAPNR